MIAIPFELENPQWLIVVILLPFVWKSAQLFRPLRFLVVIFIILALSAPKWLQGSRSITLWALMDRSLSVQSKLDAGEKEWISILEKTRPYGSELRIVDFAAGVAERVNSPGYTFEERRDSSKIAQALRFTVGKMQKEQNNRVVLFTDGYGTDDLTPVKEILLRESVAVDIRPIQLELKDDIRVESLNLPNRVPQGASVVVEATAEGDCSELIFYELRRNNTVVAEGQISSLRGRKTLRFSDTPPSVGAYSYQFQVSSSGDHISGNNTKQAWIEVRGPGKVLLLSPYPEDPVANTLTQRGWKVERPRNLNALNTGSLTGVRVVIFNNIHVSHLPREFLFALDFYVEHQGGGLLMLGGENSFGSGGYFNSPIEHLLPVTLELREEHRRLGVAMALVLDRSGSMGASVTGNMGTLQKMDLANEGAARSVELLSPMDEVSVLAVDTTPEYVVRLQEVGTALNQLQSKIRSTSVGGGGIYVYEGLRAAWEELRKAKQNRKHLILFSDAADSEEPGDYKKLLQKVVAAGGSVSVIGLGTPADTDAALLTQIAELGSGRVFFVSNATELPAVFAQETTSVARSVFVKEPTPLVVTPDWRSVSLLEFPWLQKANGYNLTYARKGAVTSVISGDEYAAPIVAGMFKGFGRSLAITVPMAGNSSENIRGWNSYADFLGTTVEWVAAKEIPEGISLRTKLEGSLAVADFYYSKKWEEEILSRPPQLVVSEQVGHTRAIPWTRLSPGHFNSKFELPVTTPVVGALAAGPYILPFGPIGVEGDVELEFDPRSINAVQDLVKVAHGKEIVDLGEAWRPLHAPQSKELSEILLWGSLLLFLVELLIFRLGLRVKDICFGNVISLERLIKTPIDREKFRGIPEDISQTRITEVIQTPDPQLPTNQGDSSLSSAPSVGMSAVLTKAKNRGVLKKKSE